MQESSCESGTRRESQTIWPRPVAALTLARATPSMRSSARVTSQLQAAQVRPSISTRTERAAGSPRVRDAIISAVS